MKIHKLMDSWFLYFESILLGRDIYKVEDFRYIVDTLPLDAFDTLI